MLRGAGSEEGAGNEANEPCSSPPASVHTEEGGRALKGARSEAVAIQPQAAELSSAMRSGWAEQQAASRAAGQAAGDDCDASTELQLHTVAE